MKTKGKIEAKESRRRAVERILVKKREILSTETNKNIVQQEQDNRFRMQWRTQVKGKVNSQLEEQLDFYQIREAINSIPTDRIHYLILTFDFLSLNLKKATQKLTLWTICNSYPHLLMELKLSTVKL